jgi:hypothetical protein
MLGSGPDVIARLNPPQGSEARGGASPRARCLPTNIRWIPEADESPCEIVLCAAPRELFERDHSYTDDEVLDAVEAESLAAATQLRQRSSCQRSEVCWPPHDPWVIAY